MTRITTVQWNIGGGKIQKPDSEPDSSPSYTEDGLGHIIDFLKSTGADIITLQEVHKDEKLNQAEYLAGRLSMPYYVSDFYDDSHIEEGQKLGQAVLSKFPISNSSFEFYINPKKQTVSDDGLTIWHSHDKGCTQCSINLGSTTLQVATTHFVPFRKFDIDIDSDEGQALLTDIEHKLITDSDTQLIQGDFNLDMPLLSSALPSLTANDLQEVRQDQPTTPKGRRYDHVIFKGITLDHSKVVSNVRTDHYPIVTTFGINESSL